MPRGNTVPLYTFIEGKRDNVVSVGIKNRRIVGNHYFSLCLVPIIQTRIIICSKIIIIIIIIFSTMEPGNLKEYGGLTPCSKSSFKS